MGGCRTFIGVLIWQRCTSALLLVLGACFLSAVPTTCRMLRPSSFLPPLSSSLPPPVPNLQQIPDCTPTSLYHHLPPKFEPSDITFQPATRTLYIVSDDGRLAAMQNVTSDTATKIWDIGKEYDLEGISVIEDKEDLVYLGVEYPAAVLEYNVTSATIQKKWDIQPMFEAFPATTVTTTLERRKKTAKPKAQVNTIMTNAGLESLLFVRSPSPSPAAVGHFLVGRQADARVFIFTALKTSEGLDLKHVGTFSPPGPATDLSALTIHSNALYLLYDKPRQLISLPLTTIYSLLDDKVATDISVDLSTTQGVHTFTSSSRGWEGISFFEENGTNYVIVGVDPPKKKGKKDLLLWSEDTFFACTSPV
ncbi:hypothetical protein HDU85_001523 [Gaertneriomyces sp. JEL0708]|nr:hypothetical protein HDU85_001523 [Gaertneriomyces sp. JEL0708]